MNRKRERSDPFITEDSILTGILIAINHRVIPQSDERQRVAFCVFGDVQESLRRIYANEKVGMLDVLSGIKTARSMIFSLRKGLEAGR